MSLAQGRYWRASLTKGGGSVVLEFIKGSLPEDLEGLREFRIEVPLAKWNRVVKNVHTDRKLLGGLLLDFGKVKDRVAEVVGNERLLVELQRIVLDATTALIEEEVLVLEPVEKKED